MEKHAYTPYESHPAQFCWKRRGWLVIEILLFIVVIFATSGFILFVAGIFSNAFHIEIYQNSIDSPAMMLSEISLAIGSVLALYVVIWLSRHVFPQTPTHTGFTLKGHGRELLAGAGTAMALYAVGFLLVLLSGSAKVTDTSLQVSALVQTWILFFFVALFEETTCRGFLLGRMMDAGINKFAALVISSGLFSILHLGNPDFTVLPFVNLFLAGVLLGSAYIYTRNLWFAIMLHWFWNWLQGPVLGFEVSGNPSENSLLTLQTTDNVLLNGGGFGFEGSLICTVLMIAGIFLIIRYYEQRRRLRPKI